MYICIKTVCFYISFIDLVYAKSVLINALTYFYPSPNPDRVLAVGRGYFKPGLFGSGKYHLREQKMSAFT